MTYEQGLTEAGHARDEQLHGTPRPTSLPVIDSPAAAGQALKDLFLAKADRDDAANDHLVAEPAAATSAEFVEDTVATTFSAA